MPTARKHHYLPQCYLKSFAQLEGKNWQTWVLDLQKKRQFRTNIENVAAVRDFNRIDIEGVPIDAVEQALSALESRFADVFTEIINNQSLPTGENFIILLNFIALVAARNPQFRNQLESLHDQLGRAAAEFLVADKKVWDNVTAKAKAKGIKLDDTISYEDVKEFVKSDEYEVKLHTTWRLDLELTAVDEVLKTLLQRRWAIVRIQNGTDSFICSDRPVSLRWNSEVKQRPLFGPGFGMLKTILIMPIAHKLALLGTFESEGGAIVANSNQVAAINAATLAMTDRQVYSREQNFSYLNADMKIVAATTLASSDSK
jgi:hypothetical protein